MTCVPSVSTRRQQSRGQTRPAVSPGLKFLTMLSKAPALSGGPCKNPTSVQAGFHDDSRCCTWGSGPEALLASGGDGGWAPSTTETVPADGGRPRRIQSEALPAHFAVDNVEAWPSAREARTPSPAGAGWPGGSAMRCGRCRTHILAVSPHGVPQR